MKHIEIEIPHESGVDHVEIWLNESGVIDAWQHWRENDDALYDVQVTEKKVKGIPDHKSWILPEDGNKDYLIV